MVKICPVCKSSRVTLDAGGYTGKYRCEDCDYVGVFIIEVDESEETFRKIEELGRKKKNNNT